MGEGITRVIVYTQPNCAPCKALKGHLDGLFVRYEERDVRANERYMSELVDELGFRSTPVLKVEYQNGDYYETVEKYDAHTVDMIFQNYEADKVIELLPTDENAR